METPGGDASSRRTATRLSAFVAPRMGLLRDYASAISGSAGRLIFSLLYFVALANTLSIADFGLFATASATGVMLSRILAFGFTAALYRVATVRRRLIGVFSAGFLLLAVLSLPLLAAASLLAFMIFFAGEMALGAFLVVVAAEALFWRPVEVVVIVNNGMGRFGRASILVILGVLLRSVAAVAFMLWPAPTLADWTWFYLAANAISLALAVGFFHPRYRLRLAPRLYWRRLPDSLYVAGAELLFYLQMEMDKLLVLTLGGAQLAGVYAIIMRLVDLTAIPIRTFSMMLVQRLMRTPDMLAGLARRAGIEAAIFAVSTLGLLAFVVMLGIFPNMLGRQVAEVTPLVGLVLLVPGFRNLLEYQAELLFARGQTLIRAVNLAILGALKAALLALLLLRDLDVETLLLALNAAFGVLYVASAVLTYVAMRRRARRV